MTRFKEENNFRNYVESSFIGKEMFGKIQSEY